MECTTIDFPLALTGCADWSILMDVLLAWISSWIWIPAGKKPYLWAKCQKLSEKCSGIVSIEFRSWVLECLYFDCLEELLDHCKVRYPVGSCSMLLTYEMTERPAMWCQTIFWVCCVLAELSPWEWVDFIANQLSKWLLSPLFCHEYLYCQGCFSSESDEAAGNPNIRGKSF